MTPTRHDVRTATAADTETLIQILADGFREDPPLAWILPDADERARLIPTFFRPFVDLTLAQGTATVTHDLSGAALWLHVDVTATADDDTAAFRQLFIDGLGPDNANRFFLIDEMFAANHPNAESHEYLMFVGAVTARQSSGVGSALLDHRLTELDDAGIPVYLEASSERNSKLYARHGFKNHGNGITLPSGPTLHPMWRPATAGRTATI